MRVCLHVIAICLVTSGLGATSQAHAECRLDAGPRRTVATVIDGETLRLDDGGEVRLAGVLAPRGLDAGVADADWPAAMAATAALRALTAGRTVALGFSGTSRRDRANRHVAQVFVIDGDQETWVQGRMLSDGHARATQSKDQRGCADELLAHERQARDAGKGLWAMGAYLPRSAINGRELEGMGNAFAVLSGRVAWVAEGRESVALGFTPSSQPTLQPWRIRNVAGRRGVVVMIENRDRALLGTLGGDAKALEGQRVEVRGWLEHRLGRPPGTYVIDVSPSGMIQVLAPEGQGK